jgi:predicted PurR-regulated permease PerM
MKKKSHGKGIPFTTEPLCPYCFKAATVLAGILAAGGIVFLIVSLAKMLKRGTGEEVVAHWSVDVGLSLILLALASILFSLVWIARTIRDVEKTRDSFSTLLTQNLKTTAAPQELVTQDLEQLQMQMTQAVHLLHEINENSLLDEHGRRQKFEFLAHQDRKRIFNDI